jgi:3-oxoadipate enol-lactonase
VPETEYDTSFITVGDVRLRLAVAGSGPPLMFLFGSGRAGTIDNAKPLTNLFTDQFTVACPDQRGLGQSDIPPGPWTMADYADDAFGIADHLSWEKFSVMGLSFGGMVGLEMAAAQPERIDRMVLWGTSPGGREHSYPLHTLIDAAPTEQRKKFAELMDTRLSGQWNSTPSPESLLVKAVLDRGGLPFHVAAEADQSRNLGFELQLDARRNHDVTSRLSQIRAATLIGAGIYDGLAPVANAETMHAKIRNSVIRIYDAGHFFYLGNKRPFSDALNFLSTGKC